MQQVQGADRHKTSSNCRRMNKKSTRYIQLGCLLGPSNKLNFEPSHDKDRRNQKKQTLKSQPFPSASNLTAVIYSSDLVAGSRLSLQRRVATPPCWGATMAIMGYLYTWTSKCPKCWTLYCPYLNSFFLAYWAIILGTLVGQTRSMICVGSYCKALYIHLSISIST